MCMPGQSQILGPQNVAYSSSGQAVAPVMDNPVPPSLGSTLIPNPSPVQVSTSNAAPPSSDSTATLDSLQNKVDNLSIQSQTNSHENNCAYAVNGSQDTMQSDDSQQGVPKKDDLGDLDPLWSQHKI